MDNIEHVPGRASAERYYSAETAKLERERLWPNVWLMACRLEEVEGVGDFATFDIDRESIIVVRTSPTELKAYYNVCQHRGRRLKEGCGNTGKAIFCPFHGWRWTLDGQLERVVNREDFEDAAGFSDTSLRLQQVLVDHWGGWVFVSMNPDIEPLLDYLAPIPEIMKNFELNECRYAWYVTLTFPCNWKTVINAFNENYHVETTHPQLNKYGLMKAPAVAHGRHSQFRVEGAAGAQNMGTPGAAQFKNAVETIQYREEERFRTLKAMSTPYSLAAARRLGETVSAAATAEEALKAFRELHRAEVEEAGAKWPANLTNADIARAGIDWHLFPNMVFLPNIDGALIYRARPDPNNPEVCLFDVWWMQRYGEGKHPAVEQKFFHSLEDAAGINPFLEQDFGNLKAVQKGIHSRGFRGSMYNPVQEVEILNFESNLDRYLEP